MDRLHEGLQREHGRAKEIREELDLQEGLLNRVDGKIQHNDRRVRKQTRKVGDILKENKCNCFLYIIIILLVLLLIAMVATHNFGMGYWDKVPKNTTASFLESIIIS